MTNFERVRTWMLAVGQDCPVMATLPNHKVLSLRSSLISEERDEVIEELDFLIGEGVVLERKELLDAHVRVAKELCDLLVVTYGTLAALGIEGDKAMQLVCDNNDEKNANAVTRPDGKIIVPPAAKAALKKKMTRALTNLIQ